MPAKWDKKRRAWPDTKDFHGIDIIPHFDKTQKQYYNRKAFIFCSGGSYCYDREDFDDQINTLLNALLGDNHSYKYIDSIEIFFRHDGAKHKPASYYGLEGDDDETGLEH